MISINYSQDTHIDSAYVKDPSYTWKLSLIPGLGQLYNGNIHKSFIINSALSISYIEINQRKNNINKRNTWAWWFLGIYVLGIIDSYIDSHLTSFPKKK